MILLVYNFFPKPLVIEFLLTNNGVRFSSSIIRLEIFFFSVREFFLLVIFLEEFFFLKISPQDIFF